MRRWRIRKARRAAWWCPSRMPNAAACRSSMPPVRLEGTPAGIRRRAPDLGEHDAEIRAWLTAEEG
ncbi:hypothetical protein [Dankookia sp. P2]|uniref:hypothetical protein n=1 Tax=Dankookia sp. P2 TaxID=3423955 RepID=UPI003D670FE9